MTQTDRIYLRWRPASRLEPVLLTVAAHQGLLRSLTCILAVFGTLYAALLGIVLRSPLCGLIPLLAAAAFLLAPPMYHWSGSKRLAANYLLGVIFVALGAESLLNGGLPSPALAWLIMLPVMATMLVGPRCGLAWVAVAAVLVTSLGILELQGIILPNLLGPTQFHIFDMASLIGLPVVIYASLLIYHRDIQEATGMLRDQASRDGLTGLYNHRSMLELLRRIMQNPADAPQTFALLMVDVDHFKGINDRFGHAAGDLALQAVAGRIRRSVRESDYVGRFGGDEFLCALPDCAPTAAREVAEKICRVFEESPIALGSQAIPLTISVGIAHYDAQHGDDLFQVLRSADEALYEAKNAGRNQVRLATSDVPEALACV